MDNGVYRSELDRVRYTAEGRTALADHLMRAQSDERGRRSAGWPRKMMAAAIAAVVLVGTAADAAGPLWERYFGRLDEGQQAVINNLSTAPETLPAVESNGTVMTPLAAFGDQDFYYLMLEIRAPEGTVLPDYGEEEGYYQLFGDELGEKITLTDEDGQELPRYVEFEWMPRTGEENILTAVIRLWPAEGVDFSDGTDKVLHIPGLWVQSPDKEYTPVLTGGWDFNIGAHSGQVEVRERRDPGDGGVRHAGAGRPAALPSGNALEDPLDQPPGGDLARREDCRSDERRQRGFPGQHDGRL